MAGTADSSIVEVPNVDNTFESTSDNSKSNRDASENMKDSPNNPPPSNGGVSTG